jgi:Leucine-rich repeat (LRR) protein
MAEGALNKVAEGVIGQLGNLVVQEIGLLWGAKDDLEKLQKTVSAIKAVLLDAEEKQVQSHAIKDWVENLKDALYEADDVLDNFSTESLRREQMTRNKKAKKVRIFFSKSNQLAYGLKMAHNIKAIREKLDAINANRMEFHLVERVVETQVRSRMRETHYFVRADDVIGREDDKKVILKRLLDSNIEENVSILPIVGIGGLGKTTLAQLVFNHEEIQKHFEKKLWVCISDDFDVRIIVEKILECAKGKKQEENLAMNTLVNELEKEIDGKRYLLVLDDVWNDDSLKWDDLKGLLLNGARGSRILVTTRGKNVAEVAKTIEPYFLSGLNEEESWSLFRQKAFEKGQEPENLRIREIGKEIVGRCRGIPLAIKTIGSILYFKKTEEDWLSFKNNEFSKVDQKENDILPTLRLSYDHLPSNLNLKQCFAYCSLFPKDYMFNKKTLIQQWMAQGFIKLSAENQCIEDVGHEYFMDLLWRSFFQEVEEDDWGNIKFKIHDLMHDLAISVAGLENRTCGINGETVAEKTHHVSFGINLSSSSQIPNSLSKACRMRTFLLPNQSLRISKQKVWERSTCDAFFSSFKFLRLLDLNHTGISNVPYSIGKLKHLRYLDLSHNKNIKMLPNSITRLHNLQTLKLSWCRALKELPRDFYKLVNLRHLVIDCCFNLSHMPRGLEQLTNLQTLSNFVLSKKSDSVSGLTRVLKELHGLRGDLEILDLRHGKDGALEPNILKEKHLQNLTLFWLIEDVDEADVGYDEMSLEALQPHPNLKRLCIRNNGGGTFPSWLPSLTNLVRLVLINQKKWQHLPSLVSFPSLKYIYLESLDSLENISEMEWQSLSRLSSLILITLPNLVSIPVGIQHITTLQSLCIMDCPISLERCKRETGEDWPKIAHIPSLEGDLYGL